MEGVLRGCLRKFIVFKDIHFLRRSNKSRRGGIRSAAYGAISRRKGDVKGEYINPERGGGRMVRPPTTRGLEF